MERETRAWDTQDVELLLSVFHQDFVWVWPPHADAHDPVHWTMGMGRFDARRWRRAYGRLFAERELVSNERRIVKVEVAREGDGAFAVVDVDTRWRDRTTGDEDRWRGRACKVYALVDGEWKLTMHTGLLGYPLDVTAAARRWVDVWSRAWPAADAAAVATLYADGALFYSHPFRQHRPPVEYAAWAFVEQAAAECRFGTPVVEGDRAAVDWCAVVTSRDGSVETVAGTSLLRFDADGLVVEQRDAWASAQERVELAHWARA